MSTLGERIVTDPIFGMETMFSVLKEDGRIKVPFVLRDTQRMVIEIEQEAMRRGINKILIPKARRHGITTVQQGMSLWKCCTKEYAKCGTMAHTEESTKSIFRDIALVMFESIPDGLKPVRDGHGMSMLRLKNLKSEFIFATAGGSDPFRGQTLSRIHVSEAAFIDTLSENRRALHAASREGVYVEESTGNGCVGAFYESCMETLERGEMIKPGMYIGTNLHAMLFLPWFLDPKNVSDPMGVIVPDEPRAGEVGPQCDGESKLLEGALRGYGMDISGAQLAWRRRNRADGDQRTGFPQEFPEDLMDCFLSTSSSRFDSYCVQEGKRSCVEPEETSQFDGGTLKTWEGPDESQLYVIGVDLAEGVDGGDYTYITVHKRERFEQVACWHGSCSPESAARIAFGIAIRYGYAEVAAERNNHGHTFLLALTDKYGYENVMVHDDGKFGWLNNKQTRTIAINDLANFIHNGAGNVKIHDTGFWRECLTFERQKSGKYEARRPNHDDRIISVAIAYQCSTTPLVQETWSFTGNGFFA